MGPGTRSSGSRDAVDVDAMLEGAARRAVMQEAALGCAAGGVGAGGPGAGEGGSGDDAFDTSASDDGESGVDEEEGSEVLASGDSGGDDVASWDSDSQYGGQQRQPKRGRGRPAHVQVNEDHFLARCNEVPVPSNAELMDEYGVSYNRVRMLKRKLGCGQKMNTTEHRERVRNITFDSLQSRWVCEDGDGPVLHRMRVAPAVKTLALELGVGVDTLKKRMKEVEFNPVHPYSLSQIEMMVRQVLETHSSGQMGASFMEAKLRLPPFNLVGVRLSRIRAALQRVDALNYSRRRKPDKKTPAQYTVKGARSLYHIDAHEKLAKLWGVSPLT